MAPPSGSYHDNMVSIIVRNKNERRDARRRRRNLCAHLGGQEKARERGAIDSRELVQDRQRGQHPVALIDLFSWGMQMECSH